MSDAPPRRGRPRGAALAGALIALTLSSILAACSSGGRSETAGPPATLTAWPSSGLVDDARVDVRAERLDPGALVSFALCEEGAQAVFDDRCFPYDAVPLGTGSPGQGRTVGDDGTVVTQLRVYADAYAYDRRVDCRVEPCELVVTSGGAVLAGAPLSFDRSAALVGPARLTVSPATGLVAGEQVEVLGSGFYAGEPVLIEQCAADSNPETCIGGPSERLVADEAGRLMATLTVRREAATDQQGVDCLVVECVLRADRYDFVPVAARAVEAPIALGR